MLGMNISSPSPNAVSNGASAAPSSASAGYYQYQYQHHPQKAVYSSSAAAPAPSMSSGQPQSPASYLNQSPLQSQQQQQQQYHHSQTTYKVLDIGTQFCKQYYKMLSVEPEVGHKFYSKHSFLCHGQEGDLEAPQCHGIEEIQQRLLTMGFAGCRVFISTIDCQASVSGGVVMLVMGRMQMRGGMSRKFVQTIFLAEQPTGFFVMNDVFRFIDTDETQSPLQLAPLAPSSSAASSQLSALSSAAPSSTLIPAAPSTGSFGQVSSQISPLHGQHPQYHHQQPQPATASSSQSSMAKSVDSTLLQAQQGVSAPQVAPATATAKSESISWGDSAWAVEDQQQQQQQQQQQHIQKQPQTTNPGPAAKDNQQQPSSSTLNPKKKPEPIGQQPVKKRDSDSSKKTQETAAPSAEKLDPSRASWADITVTNKSQWGNGLLAAEAKGTSVTSPTPQTPSSGPKQFRTLPRATVAPPVGEGQRSGKTGGGGRRETDQSGKPMASGEDNRQTGRRPSFHDSYNPEASIYIGGLRQRADESAVREAFVRFGEIKVIELAAQCAFVEFASSDSAQRAVASGTHKLGGAEVRAEKRRPPRSAPPAVSATAAGPSAGRPRFNRPPKTATTPSTPTPTPAPSTPSEGKSAAQRQ